MSIINQIKKELNQLGIKPKKSLGQNFLITESVYQKIISALELTPNDTVVEVGPGLGTLTEFLASSEAKIIAVEKDSRCIEHLKQKFRNQKNVTISEGDVLAFNPTEYNLMAGNWKLVGNIPYYITSHLIRVALENWPAPKSIVLMMQKEVAQRICAKPPHMSLLAVSVQYYAQPKIISHVSRGNFYPSPEVDSSIIKLVLRDAYQVLRAAGDKFFEVVKAGFAGKRKQLGNNLSAGLKLEKKYIEERLTSIDINPMRRAETLTLEQWQNIVTMLLPR